MPIVLGYNPEAKKQKTCRNCAAIVEYTLSEAVEKKYGFDYLGGYETGKFIICPGCGKDMQV